jgi:murein DD-endopeptidase MepM/ murein hydrolase activator NlpD
MSGKYAATISEKNVAKGLYFLLFTLFFSLNSFAGTNYPFSVETEKEGNGHRIVAKNNGPALVSVKVSLTDSLNIAHDRPFPVFAVVPPHGGVAYLARIWPAVGRLKYTFYTRHSWILGDFNARQDPNVHYRLPYPDGSAFRIGQAPGGPITTHRSKDSRYAVDIDMPQGTPVVAARDGVVILAESGHASGGTTPDFLDKANEIQIQHSDGTIAVYAHLAYGGVHVHPGQRVLAGTPIGLSGSTGYSFGPHLHFAVKTVEKNGDDLSAISLPFRFYTGDPPVVFSPQHGMRVSADYASSSRIPARQQASAARPASPASRTSASPITFEVPAPIRSWLLGVPIWKWIMGMHVLVVLPIVIGKFRKSKKRRRFQAFQEPVLRSQPLEEYPGRTLSYRDRLILACGGDRQKADFLQKKEYARQADISPEEAAWRAYKKLQETVRQA